MPPAPRRLLIGIALLGGGLVCLVVAVLAWGLVNVYRAADYAGARLVADHSLYHVFPSVDLRRDTSYRSTAEFPQVYNWYSQRFGLGPEARAESACITMQKADALWIVRRETVVIVCDAGRERLIFVTRAFSLRWR